MFFRRSFSATNMLRLNSEFSQQVQWLRSIDIPDLHTHNTVALSSQTFKGRCTVDYAKAPVVMLHGLFGAKQNYSSVGRLISTLTKRHVIGLDLRNHGSSSNAWPHDYEHMTKDVLRYIATLNQKVILVGHSMGAKVAMLAALKHPQLVGKLVVIDNAPVRAELDENFTLDLLAMCNVQLHLDARNKSQAELLKEADRMMEPYEPDALVRTFLISNLKRPQTRSTHRENVEFRVPVLNFLKKDVLPNLGEWPANWVSGLVYEKPVLVMRGLKSDFVSDETFSADFRTYFTSTTLVDFDCGHWIVSEQPDKFVKETVDFIESS